jgi:ribosomal protein S18 acetylase RimI-like enzyme
MGGAGDPASCVDLTVVVGPRSQLLLTDEGSTHDGGRSRGPVCRSLRNRRSPSRGVAPRVDLPPQPCVDLSGGVASGAVEGRSAGRPAGGTPAAVRTRPATVADGPRLAELDRLTWSTTSTPAPAPEGARDPFERRPPWDHLVAEVEGRVVGYVALGHPTPLPASAHVWEVQGLAVDPAVGGRGVGRALVDAAVAEAADRGATKLTLRVLATNAVARRLYERAGFVVAGVLEGEFLLDGRLVDDVLMVHRLGGAGGPPGRR